MLTSMVFWMHKAARSIKATLHASIDAALARRLRAGPAARRHGLLRRGARGAGIGLLPARDLRAERRPRRADRRRARPRSAPIGVGYGIYRGGVRLQPAAVLPLDGRIHPVRRRRPAGRLAARAARGGPVERPAGDRLRSQRASLPADGALGSVLAGIFGYQDTPTIGEVARLSRLSRSRALPALSLGRRRRRAGRSSAPDARRASPLHAGAVDAPRIVSADGRARRRRRLIVLARRACLRRPQSRRAAAGRACRRRSSVAVTASACDPNELTVPAGPRDVRDPSTQRAARSNGKSWTA